MGWICAYLNPSYCGLDQDVILERARDIFGDDLLDIEKEQESDDVSDLDGCYYFFNVKNYFNYVSRLREDSMIKTVLPDYDSPQFLEESEIKRISGICVEQPQEFRYGDMVKVKTGYLSNLIGLVEKEGRWTCVVRFRFHTCDISERVPVKNLVFIDNVFRHHRCPVEVKSVQGAAGRTPVTGLHKSVLEIIAFRLASEISWDTS